MQFELIRHNYAISLSLPNFYVDTASYSFVLLQLKVFVLENIFQ